MENVITELGKYLMLLMTILYTYLGFAVFRKGKKTKKWIYQSQTALILLVHLTGFMLLFMQQKDQKLLWLYLGQMGLLALSNFLYRRLYRNLSTELFLHMQFLMMIGFVFVTRLDLEDGIKQSVLAGAALLLCLLVPLLIRKITIFPKLGWGYAFLGIALLSWVLAAGTEIYGATNWVQVLGITFQPSEVVKILYVFMLAAFLSKKADFRQVVLVALLSAVHVFLLVLEKDLGGALILYVTFIMVLFTATKSYGYLFAGIGGGVVASLAAYSMFYHVQVRVLAWRNPWDYIDKEGYQVAQSLFGIGTGGWFGMGLGKGLPKSTPIVISDFIFSGISEELGGLYAVCLILIYISTFLLFIQLAWRMKEPFWRNVSIGSCIIFAFQVFLCIGGTIKLIPSTGVTLPLISYGGSSLIATIIMFSIVQGLYITGRAGRPLQEEIRIKTIKSTKKTVTVTYLFLTLFLLMIGYFGYYITFESKEVLNNTYNKRQDLYAEEILRGEILASDGTVLAYSREKEDDSVERIYPYGEMFSHFVGRCENGKTGVEALMNFELLSSHSPEWNKLMEKFNGERNQGDIVTTTADINLQYALDSALNGKQGAGVVLEPSTGKILSMVSKPGYDPNTVTENWESLTNELESESRLLNRAASGLYPPGSTFKIFTTLGYMRQNPDWNEYLHECEGTWKKDVYRINCYHKKPHGSINVTDAFSQSCNTFYAAVGSELNLDAFGVLMETMLFNQELPVSFPHQSSSYSLNIHSETDEIIQTMIGQGKTQITPLHNAMLVAAVANKGVLMKPYAVNGVKSPEGETVKEYLPESYGTFMTIREAEIIKSLMKGVIEQGTAKQLADFPFPVYAKTGTAEYISSDGSLEAHSWIVGFAEQDEKQIAFSILIEGDGRGNYTATDAAQELLKSWQ